MKVGVNKAMAAAVIVAIVGLVAYVASQQFQAKPPAPRSFEKRLSELARKSSETSPQCESFFAEWGTLLRETAPLDDKRLTQLARQVRRYPGVPASTRQAWKSLATAMPAENDVDVAFAFGLADCQYEKFTSTLAKVFSGHAREGGKGLVLAKPVFRITEEILGAPLSRQALFETVALVRVLDANGWLQWESPEASLEWARTLEYLKQFNARAEVREGELTQKVFKAGSFQAIPEEDRKGIAAQLRYSYAETEKTRVKLGAFRFSLRD